MQQRICDALYDKLKERETALDPSGRAELFCRIAAAVIMAEMRFYVEHDCENTDFMVQMTSRAIQAGN